MILKRAKRICVMMAGLLLCCFSVTVCAEELSESTICKFIVGEIATNRLPVSETFMLRKEQLNTRHVVSSADAMPLFRNGDKWTALTAAIAVGNDQFASFLIGKGADPNTCTEQGYSALWLLAGRHQQSESSLLLAELLVASGAKVDAFPSVLIDGPHKITPLHLAVVKQNTALVEVLLDAGADQNARDSNGNTPVDKLNLIESSEVGKIMRVLFTQDTVDCGPPNEKEDGVEEE